MKKSYERPTAEVVSFQPEDRLMSDPTLDGDLTSDEEPPF